MFKFLVIASTTVLIIVTSQPLDSNRCMGKCPLSNNQFDNPTLLAHEDCTKYCFCKNGCPTVRTCPERFHFSWDERMCLPIGVAKCDDRNNCLRKCPFEHDVESALLYAHMNRSKYCHCHEWGIVTVENCPESLIFYPEYGLCKTIEDCNNTITEKPRIRTLWPNLSTSTVPPKNHDSTTPLDILVTVSPVDDNPKTPVYHLEHSASTLAPKNDVSTTPLDISITVPPVDDSPTTPGCPYKHSTSTLAPKKDISTTPLDISVTVPPVNNKPKTLIYHSEHSTSRLAPKKDVSTTPLEISITAPPEDDNRTTPGCPYKHSTSTLTPNIHGSPAETKNRSYPETPEIIKISNGVDDCIGYCPPENDHSYTVHLAHKNCSLYCKCDWGTATVMMCPIKLHFNRNLKICDYPEDAKCSGI